MKKLFLPLIVLAVILGVVAGNEVFNKAPNSSAKSGAYVDPPGGDFTLDSNQGKISLSDYDGRVRMLYFGYTFCPDVCPSSLSDLKLVQNKLDESGEKIQVIMVTVDPERDTPEKIAEYVNHFHPTFIGLSGTKEEVDAAGKGYGVYYEKHEGTEATGYLVDHTARIFVIEPDGTYRLSFGFGTPVDDIVSDLRLLLR